MTAPQDDREAEMLQGRRAATHDLRRKLLDVLTAGDIPRLSLFEGAVRAEVREELAEREAATNDALEAIVRLLGDRDLTVTTETGAMVTLRFGKGSDEGPRDSRTGLPLGPGHFSASAASSDWIERLSCRLPGIVSVHEGVPLAARLSEGREPDAEQ